MTWTLDNSTQIAADTVNPLTVSHTCSAETTLLVLVLWAKSNVAASSGTPTYNGDPMTDSGIGYLGSAEAIGVEIFYRLNPDTGGSYTVSIPNAATETIGGSVMSFESTDDAQTDQANSGTGTSDAPSITVSSVANNALMIGALASGARDIPSAGANYLLVHTYDAGNQVAGSEYDLDVGAGGTITVDFTTPQNEDYALIGVSFSEVVAPPRRIFITHI